MPLDPMLEGGKEREELPMELEPIFGVLMERVLLPKLLLPRFGLLLKLRDPWSVLLLFSPIPLVELRVLPREELLGKVLVDSIFENEPDGAWRMALLMLFRIAVSVLVEAKLGRFVMERTASRFGFTTWLPALVSAAERTLAPISVDLVVTEDGAGRRCARA